MKTVKVALGDRSYSIQIGTRLLPGVGGLCKKLFAGRRCVIITDSNVGPLHAARVAASLQDHGVDGSVLLVPSGETAKSLAVVQNCYNRLAEERLERKSFIIALGGGVVGDLAGFVAATYLRGLPFLQIPTTLLAQVDSSVGGKVGVNLKAGKNLVGAFHQPRHVLCDLETLASLPAREFSAGIAEIIKYGIIHDARLFRTLEREMPQLLQRNPTLLASVIARCCAIKAEIVGQDETETGLRAILNFGHTIGHGLEAISSYGEYLHGEAISIGQVAAAELSAATTGLARQDVDRIRRVFLSAGLPVTVVLNRSQRNRLFQAMRLDKKVSAGTVRFVLATAIGKVVWGQAVADEMIHSALDSVSP